MRAYRVDEHGGAVQRAERLGGARAEPYAAAGGRDHGGGAVRACRGGPAAKGANRQTSVPVRFVCSA